MDLFPSLDNLFAKQNARIFGYMREQDDSFHQYVFSALGKQMSKDSKEDPTTYIFSGRVSMDTRESNLHDS